MSLIYILNNNNNNINNNNNNNNILNFHQNISKTL